VLTLVHTVFFYVLEFLHYKL